MDKKFNGKAIYNPSGKAGEYSPWACNFYTGCSNNCDYCYLKRGAIASTWSDAPKLKKCFRDEIHALSVLRNEIERIGAEALKGGMFFTFTSDPFLPETKGMTLEAIIICLRYSVPVILLSKRADWDIDGFTKALIGYSGDEEYVKRNVAFGFTLTGRDDKEPGASTNQDRIIAMTRLHAAGYKTWASIEPIIDLERSYEMMAKTVEFCDHYKVGLESRRAFDPKDVAQFIDRIGAQERNRPIYLKDSIFKYCTYSREAADRTAGNFVGVDYNIFANH